MTVCWAKSKAVSNLWMKWEKKPSNNDLCQLYVTPSNPVSVHPSDRALSCVSLPSSPVERLAPISASLTLIAPDLPAAVRENADPLAPIQFFYRLLFYPNQALAQKRLILSAARPTPRPSMIALRTLTVPVVLNAVPTDAAPPVLHPKVSFQVAACRTEREI